MAHETRETVTSPKVAICCPTGDHVAAMWAHDFARMLGHTIRHRPDIDLLHLMMPGSLIAKQREALVLEVLKEAPDYTHVLWLDTDMRFPPETLLGLLARQKRIVAGNYVERRPPFRPVAFPELRRANTRLFSRPEDKGLEEIEAVGFGCVLIELDVFKSLPRPWFCVGWVKETQEHVGEDVFFCETARRNGEHIWLDHDLSQHIGHVGTLEFTMTHSLAYHSATPNGNGHDGPVPVTERSLELVKP
ncbi:MAG TPA: hypothetical protein VJS69_02465 [Candidatus Krumholzibacteria bacterium]|nr:hypothetical protein [Candidatus Krumholzibacteria bacterium]